MHHSGMSARSHLPDVLNLGSGKRKILEALNVDISLKCAPDLVYDLRVFPWPFADDSFTRVYCYDILEHLPDTIGTMEELHRVSRNGAVLTITTPHFTSSNAFTDPTHCHQFGLFTFNIFTGDALPGLGRAQMGEPDGVPDGNGGHDHYTDVRFTYQKRDLIFLPTRKNALIRRIARRQPALYEQHLGWLFPAWFMSIELRVVKQ